MPAAAATFDKPHRIEAAESAKITRSAERIAAYYTEEARALVAAAYRRDFETLGYDLGLPGGAVRLRETVARELESAQL